MCPRWVGKYHGRHGGIVVDLAVTVQRIGGRDLRPVGGHVDKLVPAGDVAGRIDTGSGGPHPLVDPDSPVRRQSYAGLLQAPPSGVGLEDAAQPPASNGSARWRESGVTNGW